MRYLFAGQNYREHIQYFWEPPSGKKNIFFPGPLSFIDLAANSFLKDGRMHGPPSRRRDLYVLGEKSLSYLGLSRENLPLPETFCIEPLLTPPLP